MIAARIRIGGAAGALLLLGGCGVPLSDGPEAIAEAAPPTAAASSAQRPEALATPSSTTLWFVDGERLVPVSAPVASPVDAAAILAGLQTVPRDPLRTLMADPLGGTGLAVVPAPAPSPTADAADVQTVVISPTFAELTAADQVLLIGQVVLSLTELDRRPLLLVDESGAPVSVPLPDGRLRDGPVTRGDYLPLT